MTGQTEAGRRFFTTSEVARYCAVTNDGVLKWIKSGKLRAFSTPGGHGRTGGIRTPDLLVRSQSLYPTELRSVRCCAEKVADDLPEKASADTST